MDAESRAILERFSKLGQTARQTTVTDYEENDMAKQNRLQKMLDIKPLDEPHEPKPASDYQFAEGKPDASGALEDKNSARGEWYWFEKQQIVRTLWYQRERGHWTVSQLVELSRRNELPNWCQQVPPLMAAIESKFAAEKRIGIDSFHKLTIEQDTITWHDLRAQRSFSAEHRELRRRYRETGRLPRLFDCAEVRRVLGLPEVTAPHAN